jgi:hypothetical protein
MKHRESPMSLILVALTVFALLLMLAHLQRPLALALSVVGLAAGLFLLSGPAKVAAPLVAIASLAVSESLAGFRSR